jgi:hypothetical protein
MKSKAKKDIRAGMLVRCKKSKKGIFLVDLLQTNKGEGLIGIAARNIKKDELIEWNPVANTKDILRQGNVKIWPSASKEVIWDDP